MKLFSLAYKDIFLMPLSFGVSPFGTLHLSTATKGRARRFTFKHVQVSKIQSVFAWVSCLKNCFIPE